MTSSRMDTGWVPTIGFGDRLRVIRRKKQRTQLEMALLLGVKKVTYASWEAGASTPPHGDVVEIARRLQEIDGVPAAWVMGAYDELPHPELRGQDGGRADSGSRGTRPDTHEYRPSVLAA